MWILRTRSARWTLVALVSVALIASGFWVAARYTRLLPVERRIPAAQPASVEGRDAQWVQDLEFLDGELTRLHINPFHNVSADAWDRDVANLREKIPALTDIHVALEMRRLVASIGDAHTGIAMDDRLTRYPILLRSVCDGVAVVAAAPQHTDLVGALVTEVWGIPVETVISAALPFVSADNSTWQRSRALGLIVAPEFLDRAFGSGELHPGSWTLLRSGSIVESEMTAIPTDLWASTLLDAEQDGVSDAGPALWQSRRSEKYWWTRIDGANTVYVQFNVAANDPEQSFADFTSEVFDAIDTDATDRIVVDLRLNSGGDSAVFDPFLSRLVNHPLNREDRFFALIGPDTFSSGVMNAALLDWDTEVTLVGQPTGGNINGYGEIRLLTLPNSRMTAFYSVKYFHLTDGYGGALTPDVLIVPCSADIRAGRDPVLEWVLSTNGS